MSRRADFFVLEMHRGMGTSRKVAVFAVAAEFSLTLELSLTLDRDSFDSGIPSSERSVRG